MATALARSLPQARGRCAPALRLAHPTAVVDLEAAWHDATAPHRAAAAAHDHLADVIELRPARRVGRNRVAAVVFAVTVAIVLALGAGALGAIGADADGPAPIGDTVTVQPGQTLWDVAAQVTEAGGDVRLTLDRIRDLNGFDGHAVPAWTTVVLPPD